MGPRTHAEEFADLEDHAHTDFDPEDEQQAFDDSDSAASSNDDDGFDGREHYQSVGKSKLRTSELAALGLNYKGSRVSRKHIDRVDEEHDPFEGHSGDEDESIEEEGSEDGDEDAAELEDDDDEDAGTDDTSLSDDDALPSRDDRAQLRALMTESRKSVAATIAAATTADAAKGRAVKAQRQTFDSLLNTRIRLQHTLIASNTMAITPNPEVTLDKAAYEGAEAAALNLFNTLSSLREALPSQKTGEKRKRPSMTPATPSDALWSHLKQQDATSQGQHRAVLHKWSQKTASATATAAQSANKLNPTAQATLLDVLDSHLGPTSMPRHVERTKVPRSCAPVQQKRPAPPRPTESEPSSGAPEQQQQQDATGSDIYDDADFYGILLKELLEARNANASVDYSIAASNAANGGIEDEYKAARQAKSHSRPGADRKASKGRKMRYTVHEKLQNFMAPEDRGSWEQRQREELFGSLFGRQLQLHEDDIGDAAEDGAKAEEEALLLFRS